MKIRFSVLIILFILVIAINVPIFERFTITDGNSGNIVFQNEVEGFQKFYVSFTHSVNKTPVNEYYCIAGDEFILEKAVFFSYGAGMPEAGEYGSTAPKIIDGMVLMDDINKKFKSFTYYAGTYANHNLNVDGNKIYFSQFVKPQTPVIFEIKKISAASMIISYLFGFKV